MRLWSLHPKYLDQKGLVALWRESLLAQAVLHGETKGYKNHPQLNRFKEHGEGGKQLLATYLWGVYDEAVNRGYKFNPAKIKLGRSFSTLMKVTEGQLSFEINHLLNKLTTRLSRDEQLAWLDRFCTATTGISHLRSFPETNLLFYTTPGDVEKWEIIK